jgi:hypothetical protein
MSPSRTIRDGRAIALAAILTCAAAACTTTAAPRADSEARPATSAAQAVAQPPRHADVAGLIENARAARRQGDGQALHRFQVGLVEAAGQPATSAARASYERALADLVAADAIGDAHARADFRAQLRTLCAPGALAAAFEPCDATSTTWGR